MENIFQDLKAVEFLKCELLNQTFWKFDKEYKTLFLGGGGGKGGGRVNQATWCQTF